MTDTIEIQVGQPRLTVLERVTNDVVETLKRVDVANGALATLTVERPNPTLGQSIVDGLAVVCQGDPTKLDSAPQGHTDWAQPYEVWVYSIQSQNDATPIESRLNRMLADVTAAIVRDRQRSGLAFWTEPDAPEFELMDVNAVGGRVLVKFTVTYRTLRDDPFRAPGDT